MTNKQYLLTTLSGLGVSEDDVEVILLKAGIDGGAEVDVLRCDEAIYKRFSVVLKGAAQNVSEGGYSISWNMDAVKFFYTSLCSELGRENVLFSRPKISNRSNVW